MNLKLRKKRKYGGSEWTPFGYLCMIIAFLFAVFNSVTPFMIYGNNVKATYVGSVIVNSHKHHKLKNYDYTEVELLTYSGDSYTLYFWGHADFEIGVNYEIHCVSDHRYFFPWGWSYAKTITELVIV